MADATMRLTLAARWIAVRDLRSNHFPSDLFDESAWDMLLTLYVAGERDETITDTALIARIAGNPATGQRWIAHLQKAGQLACTPVDDHDSNVELTPQAREQMNALLDEAMAGLEIQRSDDGG